ncbi:hypothetical protein [Promicromonospora umidemergens]|nr:hypothetical protein [Promicromonospora umidemergens]
MRRSVSRRGRELARTFIPQSHVPDAEAEVDFGDVTTELTWHERRSSWA